MEQNPGQWHGRECRNTNKRKKQDSLFNNLMATVHIRVTNSLMWWNSCVLWLFSTAAHTSLLCQDDLASASSPHTHQVDKGRRKPAIASTGKQERGEELGQTGQGDKGKS